MLTIIEDDLSGEAIRALVGLHLGAMQSHSPPDKVHALPIAALATPDVAVWSAWVDGVLAGMGALRRIDADHGEIKSMRVAPAFLRTGIGEALLRHLLDEARARGFVRVSLETGRTAPFAAAIALYRKHGFVECAPFGDYASDAFSQCMTRLV